MDEAIKAPSARALPREAGAPALSPRQRLWKRQAGRVWNRVSRAISHLPKPGPLPFLAVSAVIGVSAVTTHMYTPAYVVSVNGAQVGIVREQAEFEAAVDRVEARVSAILDQEYTLEQEVEYAFALAPKEDLSASADFDNYLFSGVDDVALNYVLTVDGEMIGAAADRAALDGLLARLAAPYVSDDTVSVSYTRPVTITHEYTAADVEQDLAHMRGVLTASTSGDTTYEVQTGDTFMAVAMRNDMTVDEMAALNPDVDVDVIHVGQLLNIKEEVPYLGIRTVDAVTYTEEVECPVREVEDSSMYEGQTKVLDAGVPGEALVNANVTSLNGVEETREVISSTITRQPTEKVVAVGTTPRPSWLPNGYFIWPVNGTITSYFGSRYIFGSYSYHGGLDIAAPYGTTIKAADGGTVIWSGTGTGGNWSYGNYVMIDHGDGRVSIYGHCSSLLVSAGEKVYQGQAIARVGSTGRSTGNHCHFEVRIGGTRVNPLSYL